MIVEVSAPNNKCPALKYANGSMQFQTQLVSLLMDDRLCNITVGR